MTDSSGTHTHTHLHTPSVYAYVHAYAQLHPAPHLPILPLLPSELSIINPGKKKHVLHIFLLLLQLLHSETKQSSCNPQASAAIQGGASLPGRDGGSAGQVTPVSLLDEAGAGWIHRMFGGDAEMTLYHCQ